MRTVKVLLRETVRDLGIVGDVVTVAPGYARNYLIPQRLAIEANPENVRVMERHRERYEADLVAREAEISARVEALGNLRLVTKQRADDTGTLYGSVSASVVAQLLEKAGHPVAEKDVRLDEPIKSLGEHEVPVHIHGEHYGGVRLVVEAEA